MNTHLLMLVVKDMNFNVQNQVFEVIFIKKGLQLGEVHFRRMIS